MLQNEPQELDDVRFDVGVQADGGQDVLQELIVIGLFGHYLFLLFFSKELLLDLEEERL